MRIWLRDEEAVEEIEVRPLENSLFEIAETPVLAYPDACCGDIVRLRLVGECLYEIQEVIERPYGHWDFLIPGTYGASRSIYDFGDWVTSRGGRWECVMHGILFIHLPAGETIAEVKSELKARVQRFLGSEEHARLLESGPPDLTSSGSDVHEGQVWISVNLSENKKKA